MEISRATFYKYRSAVDKDYQDYLIINEVFESTKQMYGYRRLKKAILIQLGWRINHKKLLRIMNKYGLAVRYKSIYKRNYMKKYLAENAKENFLNCNNKLNYPAVLFHH